MAMSFKVETEEVRGLVFRIETSTVAIAGASIVAVNQVSTHTYKRSKADMLSQVNLTQAYVDAKLKLKLATERNPTAVITGVGRGTVLPHFGAVELGRNQGVHVQVKTGGGGPYHGLIQYGFMLPLRRGLISGGNGMGVFTRDKKGKAKGKGAITHRYGPSIDQVFRGVIEGIAPSVEKELQDTLLRLSAEAVEKALS